MLEYAFITLLADGAFRIDRDNGNTCVANEPTVESLLNKLATSGWQPTPEVEPSGTSSSTRIRVSRPAFYDEPRSSSPMRYASVSLDGESFDVVRLRFERNGWSLVDVLQPMNTGTQLIMCKPYSAPDLPFK